MSHPFVDFGIVQTGEFTETQADGYKQKKES